MCECVYGDCVECFAHVYVVLLNTVSVCSDGLFWLKPVAMVLFILCFQSTSSSCHQTLRFHCSVHLYHISLNFI